MDKNGQIAIGDANNYIKYVKDSDGKYKLKISAASLEFNASGSGGNESTNFEEVINNLDKKIDEIKDEVLVNLYISSSKGQVFKNNAVSTTLSVTIFKGKTRITNIDQLHEEFGENAYLQWKSQLDENDNYLLIPSIDERINEGGFKFKISPDDIDTKGVYTCDLMD